MMNAPIFEYISNAEVKIWNCQTRKYRRLDGVVSYTLVTIVQLTTLFFGEMNLIIPDVNWSYSTGTKPEAKCGDFE